MLARYQMSRGLRLADMPAALQNGIRQDSRKSTRHVLAPTPALVDAYLADPQRSGAFRDFASGYRALVRERFASDPAAFDAVAELARERDLFLGCSCPTARNPSVRRCHTWLALEFMQARYPDLDVRFPEDR